MPLCEQIGILGETLHQDLARAIEHAARVRETSVRVLVAGCLGFGRACRRRQKQLGERGKTSLAGHLCLAASLWLVRQIEIFQSLPALGGDQVADISICEARHGLCGSGLAAGGLALAAHDMPYDGSRRRRAGGSLRPSPSMDECRISIAASDHARKTTCTMQNRAAKLKSAGWRRGEVGSQPT